MKSCTAFILLLLYHVAAAQFNVSKLNKADIPGEVKYNGSIVNAARWVDSTGDNLVLTTQTGIVPDKDSVNAQQFVYAYHYL